jgi:hypothetical protein
MSGGGNNLGKRWKAAALKYKRGYTNDQNSLTEHVYHQILDLYKTLYSRLPEALTNTVFEKNYKEDNTENAFTMHSFLTPNFYWSLECSFDYIYRINYDFCNCPFEQEVMQMIERNEPYLPIAFVKSPQKPNCIEFYKRVLAVQEPEHIYLLTENSGNLRKLQQT